MNDLARDPKHLGNLIRRARKHRALGQKVVGIKAGLRQETISLIENGNPAAKLETNPEVNSTFCSPVNGQTAPQMLQSR